MSRAMLVTVLWRLAGAPAPKGVNTFDPMCRAAHGTPDAVTWAAENGVVSGIGGGRFDPNSNVTREQTAVILFNYAHAAAMTWARAPISRRSRTPAACPAGRRMRSRGPMQPALSTARCTADETFLDPQGSASRAQVAKILRGYAEHVVNA